MQRSGNARREGMGSTAGSTLAAPLVDHTNRGAIMSTATLDRTDAREKLLSSLHPIFRECVGEENLRFTLCTPACVNGFIYATDGRILVRRKARPEIEALCESAKPEGRFPNVDFIVKTITAVHPSEKLTCVPQPCELPDCEKCKGSGVLKAFFCNTCSGQGDEECDLGHFHECPRCHGVGEIKEGDKCGKCDGVGKQVYHSEHRVAIGSDTFLSWQLATLLKSHSALLHVRSRKQNKYGIFFMIPGTEIEGVVMPLTVS